MSQPHKNKHRNCLIGHTGFVGGTVRNQAEFASFFNRENLPEIQNDHWDTVVCAAAPGSMFHANKFPERDEAQINALMTRLDLVKTDRFILVSTVAVLDSFAGCYDEDTNSFQEALAYGRNRRLLESFVEDRFPNSLIVRLPALFGKGLRKNFIFDLLNPVPTMLTPAGIDELQTALSADLNSCLGQVYRQDQATNLFLLDRQKLASDPRKAVLEQALEDFGLSATRFHNPETTYQFYDMSNLWSDIEIAVSAELTHIHLVSEPLKARRIHHRLLGKPMDQTSAKIHSEDTYTRHASLWQMAGHYLTKAESVLDRLHSFYAAERDLV